MTSRIWVISGTSDGSRIIRALKEKGFHVIASVVTDHGESIARDAGAHEVVKGRMDQGAMADLIKEKDISRIIDASHPFAVEVSKNAMAAAREAGIRYVRYERPSIEVNGEDITHCLDFEEAARKACEAGERILYTAGSNNIATFARETQRTGKHIVARVLDIPEIVDKCIEAGINPNDIIAAKGPFTKETNIQHITQHNCDLLVTKESGREGGFMEKVDAARERGIKVVVIDRPEMDYPEVVRSIEELINIVLL